MRNKSKTRGIALVIVGVLVLMVGLILYSQVDNDITVADKEYIGKILNNKSIDYQTISSFQDEVNFIQYVQASVLQAAPTNKGLSHGEPREPQQLYEAGYGLCFDRSRVIEKALRSNGFETRHISVFSLEKYNSPLKAILVPGVRSHALSEVKTSKGWMFVDSNSTLIGLTADNQPVDMKRLKQEGFYNVKWIASNDVHKRIIFQKPFTYVYGLYSRHGKFYPPFTPVPDIYWPELVQNF
ncbi:hypothetical protein EFA69_07110 [Rufibacter immobilis]|uniref:Transglutaminase-like domain-containing protein n=1 Tax=Rufibacter immobilis TaxID=1348778 RepID=A0A3M9MZG4_9BACT|nr:transglutaminase domain-containing protein [Rufibacter immobilis]RNI30866.1 hypothetical protein EFA69_07110 [Rufibacter immobilis]